MFRKTVLRLPECWNVKMRMLKKPILLAIGWLCVGLGFLGIIMPLLPTTPFLLVAIWAFSKSSPELAERIRNHRLAGPYIRDWQDEGVIPLKAKLMAVTMMTAMVLYLALWVKAPAWIVSVVALVLIATAVYILTRPSRPGL